ncbi:hypothetical protein BpHYR1_015489 [Brachionus plicatilis]|uniref:Uncharacterized protein n=1 Tax=Brachionus plicatilis TaxID=10195 RepID=A0A3M7T0Z2_BRAPC|nr:hypothetical protein BpHYR1_015489 [Brachionus plicatilis]
MISLIFSISRYSDLFPLPFTCLEDKIITNLSRIKEKKLRMVGYEICQYKYYETLGSFSLYMILRILIRNSNYIHIDILIELLMSFFSILILQDSLI